MLSRCELFGTSFCAVFSVVAFAISFAVPVRAADLQEDTVKAYEQYVAAAEARMERERIGPREDPKMQLKRGIGGLSDVEFTVQFIQMSFGNANTRLRTQSTIDAIGAATDPYQPVEGRYRLTRACVEALGEAVRHRAEELGRRLGSRGKRLDDTQLPSRRVLLPPRRCA